MADADSNGVTHKYIYGKGLLAIATPSARYCYHFNGTGSAVALTDMSQAVVNSYAYDPFGQILGQQESVPQPFKFVGQYGVMAEPNGLYYMRARYYDPGVGRFVSEDPLGFGGGDVNLSAYVDSVGKPLPRTSLSGHTDLVCIPTLDTNFYTYADSVGKPLTRTNLPWYTDLVRIPTFDTNLYTYSGNNPVMFVDPEGKFFVEAVVWIVLATYTTAAIAPFWIDVPRLPPGAPPGTVVPGMPGPIGPNPPPIGPPPISGPGPSPPPPPCGR
jgi:RHS repeat-associated protein